jgi:3-oxoacyl-[acyl-carrier-protein] synthase-3
MLKSYIKSVGGFLPSNVVTNDELSKTVDTSHEWISIRTGINQRHLINDEMLTSDMCTQASLDALQKSDLKVSDIDLIIVATTTPDKTFPSTAALTQKKLGITNACTAFDIQAVCSGFIYALSVADSMIKSGNYKNALVIGADKMSSIVDWEDRATCVLFGDGAGAVIVSANDKNDSGIIDFELKADGNLGEILYTNGGVAENNHSGYVQMNGREVFRHAVEKMSESLTNIIKKHNISASEIKYVVPHQANMRIISAISKKLGIEESKVVATVDKHANTSAASIPLAMNESCKNFSKGDIIALTAAGGGFTWGAVLIKW